MDFFIATFPTLGDAYAALNSFSSTVHIHEFGQVHANSVVICGSASEALRKPSACLDYVSIKNLHPSILKAYFKQNSERAQKSLLVVEHPSLPQLFTLAEKLVMNHSFLPLELSRNALPGSKASGLFLDGKTEGFENLFDTSTTWKLISPVTPLLKNYL